MSNFRVPYLVGNIFGRDHQMWPTITPSAFVTLLVANGFTEPNAETFVAARQYFPVNLETLMNMAWRVREWTVSAGSFSYSGTNHFTTLPWSIAGSWAEFTMIMKRIAVPSGDPRDVRDERDELGPYTDSVGFDFSIRPWLTLRNFGVTGHAVGTATKIEGSNPPESIPVSTVGVIFQGYVIYDSDADIFYPILNISMFTGNVLPGFARVLFSSAGAAPGNLGGTLSVVDPAGGSDMDQGIHIYGSHSSDSAAEGSGVVSDITMTPTAWWPFQNSLGQAVFDESTGAPIADPFA